MSLLENGSQKTWEKGCSQSVCSKVCQVCLDDNFEFIRFTTIWELDKVSTDCQFLCNFEVIEHDTMLNLHIKLAKGYLLYCGVLE